MNLAAMAAFVCGKVRRADTVSLERCQQFLRQRYELIYNDQLWRDSVFAFSQTVAVTGAATFPNSNALAADGQVLLPALVDRVLGVRRDTSGLTVTNEQEFYRESLDQYEQSGTPLRYAVLPPVVACFPDGDGSAKMHATDAADNALEVRFTYSTIPQERFSLSVTVAAASVVMVSNFVELISVGTPVPVGVLQLYLPDENYIISGLADGGFPRRLRIRLFPKPSADLDLRVLCKKKPVPLAEDEDEPELRNVENCLLSFAQADMLEYARRYGQAAAKFQEAQALLAQLIRLETVQEAHQMRLVPEVETASGTVDGWLPGRMMW